MKNELIIIVIMIKKYNDDIMIIIIFFAFSMSIAVSDFFMDIHDKWKYPKCNIFCNIMQDSVYKSNNPIYTTCTFISSTMLLDGYTGITLKLHWMDTLKVHWNSTAPPAHPNCTSSAPQLHLQHTPTAPSVHLNCTSNAPQLHLQRTSNSAQTAHLLAPQPHLHICTRTSSAPQLHLSAPQPLQIHV